MEFRRSLGVIESPELIVSSGMGSLKRTGFPKGEPDSLYRHNSPCISSYHIQNSIQLHISSILIDKVITRVYLLYNPKDCDTSDWVQDPWAKKETIRTAEAVANLLGIFISSTQLHRQLWPSFTTSFVVLVESSVRILHLTNYPQGRVRFTSPSVCYFLVDASE